MYFKKKAYLRNVQEERWRMLDCLHVTVENVIFKLLSYSVF